MKFKVIKNIVLILCIAFITSFGLMHYASAQQLPDPYKYTTPGEELPWSQTGNKKTTGGDTTKSNQEGGKDEVPSSIAKPETYKEVLDNLTPWAGYAKPSKCQGTYQPQNQDAGTSPNTSGMFSPDIMAGMQRFMRQVYVELSKVLMIGHSLLCYSKKVAYTCLGWKKIGLCVGTLPNLNMFASGLIIYFVGILMIMSVGMYFVDISFKLGFAVLFMPVSIALWPFPPTKNKFSENLSIIIRNGMLFVLLAIGVTFAVTIVSNSIMPTPSDSGDGISGWDRFWNAIANQSTEDLVGLFAIDRLHFLVAGFGLIFAFKILASSVNDYLDYFFSDSVFGSTSPMKQMGTQAIATAKANTVDKAVSFAKDVAKTQAGRAIAGVGGGIASMSTKEGRQKIAGNVKKFTHAVSNPRQTYNAAMGKLGEKANQATHAVGSLVKGGINAATLVAPIKESTRKKMEEAIDKKIDAGTEKVGNWVENKIAHGGGELQNVAADVAAAGINNYNALQSKITGSKPQPQNFVTRDDVKGAVRQSIDSVKGDIKAAGKGAENLAANTAAAVYNVGQMMAGDPNMKTGEDIKQDLQDIKEDIKDKAERLGNTQVGKGAKSVAEGTASILGNVLKDFGESLQHNGKGRSGKSWSEIGAEKEKAKAEAAEDAAYFKSIDEYDDK